MKRFNTGLAVSLLAIGIAGAAMAQSLEPGDYMTSDHNMRTSKLIGMTVYNRHDEKIGTIDEILLPTAKGGATIAVISVGGFLGIDRKLVKVPLSRVHFKGVKPTVDADKPRLTAMPKYEYAGGGP